MNKKILSVLVLLFCLIIDCSRVKSDFEKTQEENTIQAYEEFLQKYPKSKYNEEAIQKLDTLRFEKVSSRGSIEHYRNFSKKYPNSKYIAVVNEKIAELSFSEAISNKSIADLQELLKKYPKSSFAKDAEDILTQLTEERLKQLKEEKTCKYFQFKITEVAQYFDTVVYMKVSPVKIKNPHSTSIPCTIALYLSSAWTKQKTQYHIKGIAISGKIAFDFDFVTIRHGDLANRLNFYIQDFSGKSKLVSSLPRSVKESEIALTFDTTDDIDRITLLAGYIIRFDLSKYEIKKYVPKEPGVAIPATE